MKKSTFILLAILVSTISFAQKEKYIATMKNNIAATDSALAVSNTEKLKALSAAFERIGNAEKNEWLPFYYAAYTYCNAAMMENKPAAMDEQANKIDELILKANELQPQNSELSLLKAMNATVRMLVDPMNRYMEYGTIIDRYTKESMTQDPTNPRPYFFSGMGLMNTPVQFGGGCGTAKPLFEKALSLYASFTPASELHPNWGKSITEQLLNECR